MDKNKTSTKRNPEIAGFVFPQVVHKHYLGEVGKWSTFWLPTFSVTFMLKIVNIDSGMSNL